MSIHWEQIADSTYRLKIPEGYLYRYQRSYQSTPTIVFVPFNYDQIKKKEKKR